MTLEEYKEEKVNFILRELNMAEKEGSIIKIDEWSWPQDRVEAKFPNVAATELFRKLMPDCSILNKSRWEEEQALLHWQSV